MMSTGANSDDNAKTYLITSYVLFAIVGVSFIGFLCMYRNIKLAIAIIKTATSYVAETPLVMLVPPIFVIINCGFWVFWIIFAIYVYSCGDVRKRDDLPFAQVDHT